MDTAPTCGYSTEVGMNSKTQWECKRFCYEKTTWLGVQLGVRIHQNLEIVTMVCRNKQCKDILQFNQ